MSKAVSAIEMVVAKEALIYVGNSGERRFIRKGEEVVDIQPDDMRKYENDGMVETKLVKA